MPEPLLEVDRLDAFYGDFQALFEVSMKVEAGETVAVIGANGAGKSTLLASIAGLMDARRDAIRFDGAPIGGGPAYKTVARGIALVPEGRRLFPRLSVEENLLLGAYRAAARHALDGNLDFCYATFPVLAARRKQLAGSLSGGEQQMLTLARALMTEPRILLIDEPSVGLSPLLVIHTIDKIRELKERRQLTVLMAEQNFQQAIRIADRGYVIVHGRMAYEGRSRDELADNELVRKLYLGM